MKYKIEHDSKDQGCQNNRDGYVDFSCHEMNVNE